MISHAVSTELIYTISRQFNASLDLNEVMGRVLKLTVEATGATRGSLFLLDEQGNVTHYILARPEQPPEISRQNVARVMADGLSGWIYRHQQAVLIDDTSLDERWVQLLDDTNITKSALGAPLLYQNRANGVLVLHQGRAHYFDESHLSLVASIAGQAAIAIENARLFTQIKQERETMEALITAMPIPVLLIDAQDQVTFSNQAARQLFPSVQDNQPLLDVEEGRLIKTVLEEVRQNSTRPNSEIRWPDERIFSILASETPLLGTIITFNDITELKKLDEMKTVFVETVSHDLRSPLATIHGFATLLQLEQLSERGRANLAGLMQGVTQIQSLIQNLLDLTRIEARMDEQAENCNLAEITVEVLTGFELQLAEKDMTLTRHWPPDLPPVFGNSLRLSQVVANLVGNAIKYTPQGGQIEVTISREGTGYLRLQVSDNGPGIAPEDQEQIFEKFYRAPTDEDIEGTGLGLSIVKAIVEGYGGSVWVESELGVGSTFICRLPVLPLAGE